MTHTLINPAEAFHRQRRVRRSANCISSVPPVTIMFPYLSICGRLLKLKISILQRPS